MSQEEDKISNAPKQKSPQFRLVRGNRGTQIASNPQKEIYQANRENEGLQ
jgi:hypothetical protein